LRAQPLSTQGGHKMPWKSLKTNSLPYIWTTTPKVTRVVSHCGLAIYIKKYLNAKRRIMETHIFHHAKI
jgi:hypothetical protein